ncbi:FAD/NAD(P)-binding domain-containing protein [Mytilinidion resinicola]|uniref:FAD/NAD(P)-binding domain-containing protein n=1 Tax=Mytilinidion resinicola TaxID=574789 RepID=A0A6A6Z0K0_9PEZI|nr:FAD/NAD(P)-binding domain-containing protein [Mytilinidion resinicola]KAF2814686.1 FAD/NAD(P)-binding domain-containing protein [Mytilinidion resinicola]
MGSVSTTSPEYDALIIGAGFGGCYTLHKLREAGFKTIVLDDGADLGGVWYWNCYPGARVDTKVPLYEFSDESIWRDWTWSVKYPDVFEIRKYFAHVESKLHLKKDIQFNTRVVGSQWDEAGNFWRVTDASGGEKTARYLIVCTGFAAKPYIPKFKGLDTFKGLSCHSARWPQEGIDFKDKRVAVVGNGSSGLQVIQEVAKEAAHLSVFQRNPTYSLPMKQGPLSKEDQDKSKYKNLFELRKLTFAGLDREFSPQNAADVSDEERNTFFEKTWDQGGLSFWLANYQDILRNPESSRHAYNFWRAKVLPRINDPKKAELLAPEEPPYYFGTKRATLEQRYYEVYNQDNVDLLDAKANAITEIVPNGVITADGALREVDILILATGFDSVTGGLLAIDIKGVDGQSLREKWAQGTYTNLGMMTNGFPNMMFPYGPQGPTSFCNGPTCAEIQGDWIVNTIGYMSKHGKIKIDTQKETEQAWRALTNGIGDMTLLPHTNSEYMGTNIPGKAKEMLNYLGGVVDYTKRITSVIELGYPGFAIQ